MLCALNWIMDTWNPWTTIKLVGYLNFIFKYKTFNKSWNLKIQTPDLLEWWLITFNGRMACISMSKSLCLYVCLSVQQINRQIMNNRQRPLAVTNTTVNK